MKAKKRSIFRWLIAVRIPSSPEPSAISRALMRAFRNELHLFGRSVGRDPRGRGEQCPTSQAELSKQPERALAGAAAHSDMDVDGSLFARGGRSHTKSRSKAAAELATPNRFANWLSAYRSRQVTQPVDWQSVSVITLSDRCLRDARSRVLVLRPTARCRSGIGSDEYEAAKPRRRLELP